MKTLIVVLLIAIAGVAVFLAVRARRGNQGAGTWPFYVKRPLTRPEQILYHRLVSALPGHVVLAQVQVSRVIGVKKGARVSEWNNRINRLSYDFVICSKDFMPVAAIELDDRSHDASHRIATDKKKAKATADAGLRFVRWNVKSLPDDASIKQELVGTPHPT